MKMNDIPDSKGARYPVPVTIKVSIEIHEKIQHLRKSGKDPTAFMRMLIERGFAELSDKKAG